MTDAVAAALGNPGLATWAALIGRARFEKGEAVLVNGATGVADKQAIQAAKFLGARGRYSCDLRDGTHFSILDSVEQSPDALY
jgi:NADPH-dependent curcumin reductase CurA